MIFDISPPIQPGIPVWPGDSPYGIEWTLRKDRGASCNVSRLSLSPHTGAHADAFLHCDDSGTGMGEMPLDPYLGPARILDAPGAGPIDGKRLSSLPWPGSGRLLFKTRQGMAHDPYKTPFAHFTVEAVEMMAARGVILVGIDTPSVDDFNSKTLDVHQALRKHSIANLENLDLSRVPQGDYELIAAPLRLLGVDGSPVRALLRKVAT